MELKSVLMTEGSVAEMAERQPPSGETGVRSLPAAPSRFGRVTSVLNRLVGLNQLGEP